MRKREINVLIPLFIFLILVVTILSSKILVAQQDPSDVANVLSEQFNISKDKIPTDPEQIKQLYLKEQWTKIISENKFFGPIHNLFTKLNNFYIFKVFLAYDYEFSITFFIILIIWLWVVFRASKTVGSSGIIKGWKAFLVGVLIAVILSQLRIIETVVTSVLDLTFKSENLWMRIIIIIVALGVFAVVHVLSKMLDKHFKEKHKEKIEKESEFELKKMKNATGEIKKFSNSN